MSTISSLDPAAHSLERRGVAFAPEIARAAAKYGLDPVLLAAVAAQETGGPGSNAGRNILGDGGHGHGVFQIDDRFHGFARSAAAMDPAANADYAARMIAGLLKHYGGDVREALSAYNAGSPNARGAVTAWQDGRQLGYADSVLRHYASLAGETPQSLTHSLCAESLAEQRSVNALSSFASLRPPLPSPSHHSWREIAGLDGSTGFGSIVDPDGVPSE
ncbi:MAG TPA: transglycosylase SLT domain-containing protein [Candidatus Baltobacteraceae bacterium]|nr:transglycosylase SLT domain-containing protein [Candidatus Baltobacteraceae bacterium]